MHGLHIDVNASGWTECALDQEIGGTIREALRSPLEGHFGLGRGQEPRFLLCALSKLVEGSLLVSSVSQRAVESLSAPGGAVICPQLLTW
jgi:hypothetical protein